MKVVGTITTDVSVDPIDVIEKLIYQEIGDVRNNWVVEIDSKFYLKQDRDREIEECEISKSRYDYVKSLQNVLKYIKENKK